MGKKCKFNIFMCMQKFGKQMSYLKAVFDLDTFEIGSMFSSTEV